MFEKRALGEYGSLSILFLKRISFSAFEDICIFSMSG